MRIIAATIFFILAIFLGYSILPGPEYQIGVDETNPGRRTYWFRAVDPCGNYEGNFLRCIIDVNGPEGISGGTLQGLSIWDQDPNYFVVDTAQYDPNASDPNMYGTFSITRNWRYDYQIIIQIYDSADNNSIGEMIINSRDRGKPKIDKYGK